MNRKSLTYNEFLYTFSNLSTSEPSSASSYSAEDFSKDLLEFSDELDSYIPNLKLFTKKQLDNSIAIYIGSSDPNEILMLFIRRTTKFRYMLYGLINKIFKYKDKIAQNKSAVALIRKKAEEIRSNFIFYLIYWIVNDFNMDRFIFPLKFIEFYHQICANRVNQYPWDNFSQYGEFMLTKRLLSYSVDLPIKFELEKRFSQCGTKSKNIYIGYVDLSQQVNGNGYVPSDKINIKIKQRDVMNNAVAFNLLLFQEANIYANKTTESTISHSDKLKMSQTFPSYFEDQILRHVKESLVESFTTKRGR